MWKDFLAAAILQAINLNYFSFHLILALTDRTVQCDVAIYELIINEVIACFPSLVILLLLLLMWNCELKNFNEANFHLVWICRLIKYWHREGETAASVGRERKSMRLIINKMRRWKLPTPPTSSLKVSKQFVQSVPLRNSTKHIQWKPWKSWKYFKNSFLNKNAIKKAFCANTNGKISPRRHRWKI